MDFPRETRIGTSRVMSQALDNTTPMISINCQLPHSSSNEKSLAGALKRENLIRFGHESKSQLSSRAKTQPGPGQYDLRSSIGSSPGFSLYGKIDPDFTKNEKKPGPEAYNPRPMKSSSTIRFSKGKGNYRYNLKNSIGNGLRSKFEGKLNSVPGPGEYNPRLIQTAHSFSVGSSKRATFGQTDTPGPGFYGLNGSTLGGPRVIIKNIGLLYYYF